MDVPPVTTDTIAAIATAPGIGGIGIIRLSGSASASIMDRLFIPFRSHRHYQSHTLYYGTITGRDGEVIDEILAVYMKAPHTYTREDVVEFHSHGSHLVLQAIMAEVIAAGARPAESGEFTKRAFLAGRIDLTRAEAVIDLLEAKTNSGVKLAVDQLQGNLFEEISEIRDTLVDILAVVEVAIDFPDDDVEILDRALLLTQLGQGAVLPLERLIAQADTGRIIREGVNVVIAGRPNVGKSSLLNGLLREERALVTEIPGTTRDTIEELISVKGIPVQLVDTAGIRRHDDVVEELGIERARQKLAEADLVLFVVDTVAGISDHDLDLYTSVINKKHIVILNKCDKADDHRVDEIRCRFTTGTVMVEISAKEGMGLNSLREAMYRLILGAEKKLDEQVSCAPNFRHKMILEKSLLACQQVQTTLQGNVPADLVAVDVQAALDYLGDIVGITTADDVLEKLFSRFCIGK